MSLTYDVCHLIAKKGGATLDDLVLELPGYTRLQVQDAMKNARQAGRIHTLGWTSRSGKGGAGRMPSVFYPGPKPTFFGLKPMDHPIQVRPPASVWELGHGLQIAGDWPPRFDGGRVYISPEDTEEAT